MQTGLIFFLWTQRRPAMDREVNDGGAGGTSDEEPGGDLESDEEDEGNTMGGSPRAEDDGAGRNSRSTAGGWAL
jgi:hypothetical protein